jgi:hypothetical protein
MSAVMTLQYHEHVCPTMKREWLKTNPTFGVKQSRTEQPHASQ